MIVNETLNTWTVAIYIIQRKKETVTTGTDAHSVSREWKIVVIPKHKTVLEVDVPLQNNFCYSSVTIRLET